MKNQSIYHRNRAARSCTRKYDSEKNAEINELAEKNGRHFSEVNRPAPEGDSLAPFVGELKAMGAKNSLLIFSDTCNRRHIYRKGKWI